MSAILNDLLKVCHMQLRWECDNSEYVLNHWKLFAGKLAAGKLFADKLFVGNCSRVNTT